MQINNSFKLNHYTENFRNKSFWPGRREGGKTFVNSQGIFEIISDFLPPSRLPGYYNKSDFKINSGECL